MNNENENINFELPGDREGGFMVEDTYFEKMHADIISKTSQNGFVVPDKYFESLQLKIEKKVRPQKTIRLKKNYTQIAIGIAASILLISGLFIYKSFNTKSQYAEVRINELSDEEIINYVDVSDINDIHIYEASVKSENKTPDQVEEYIINNTDEQTISDEL